MIVEALGSTMTTQVEPFDDTASVESDTSSNSDDGDMTQINFSTGSISLLIQTVPAGASIMVNCTCTKISCFPLIILVLKILEYVGVEVAGSWGGLVGLVVVSVNGIYWLLAIPNLWNFSKEKWRKWICCCQEDLQDLEDDGIWGA